METRTIFLLDDEFPKIKEFVDTEVYGKAISSDDLYHLALYENWKALHPLQQLIKDIITSEPFKSGMINLWGYADPELALIDIEKGIKPDVIIYDWQYGAETNNSKAKKWMIELIEKTNSFFFVYSQLDMLSPILNELALNKYTERVQLFLKGKRNPQTFSSEEFIFQFIISAVSKRGKIKIDGIEVEFTANNYLGKASDILYLQRILGKEYFLDQLNKVDFSIDTAGVEKILNDTNKFIYFNGDEKYLIFPENAILIGKDTQALEKLNYLDIVKKYSFEILETVLERGILYL